jgi:hypothetical protein
MHQFDIIDLVDLATVTGGAEPGTRTTTTEAEARTRAGGARGGTTETTSEPNAYLRCLDVVSRQRGWFDAPNDVEARQARLCTPLLNQ